MLGLIGPNGAGKTTLLEAIAGLLAVDAGHVLWRGRPSPPRRREVHLLPARRRPALGRSVRRAGAAFFAAVYRRPDSACRNGPRAWARPGLAQARADLSKGYERRLMLALALLTPHPLLLMDEPFDGFDLRQTRDIMDVLRESRASGRTLVLAIHQLGDAERVCDRFVLLAEGRMRGVGTLDELRAQTGSPAAGLEEIFLALT